MTLATLILLSHVATQPPQRRCAGASHDRERAPSLDRIRERWVNLELKKLRLEAQPEGKAARRLRHEVSGDGVRLKRDLDRVLRVASGERCERGRAAIDVMP